MNRKDIEYVTNSPTSALLLIAFGMAFGFCVTAAVMLAGRILGVL